MRALGLGLLAMIVLTAEAADPKVVGAAGRMFLLAGAAPDSVAAAIEADRAETRDWLKSSPTSYLAAVARVDFDERPALTLGRAADCDVRVADPAVAGRHLRITVVGDSFRVEPLDPAARFVRGRDTLAAAATLAPGTIRVGRYSVRLAHQRFPAIIVFDPESPRFAEFKGLEYFPVDLAYRFDLALQPNPNADTTVILSTRGHRRRAVVAGWFDFRIGKRRCRLEATRLLEPGVGEEDFSIFFRDATSGRETYGLGRYLDVTRLPDGRYVLDFNQAYNPACAISDYYNCPIPPRGNRLRAAIRAGEKDAHYLDH